MSVNKFPFLPGFFFHKNLWTSQHIVQSDSFSCSLSWCCILHSRKGNRFAFFRFANCHPILFTWNLDFHQQAWVCKCLGTWEALPLWWVDKGNPKAGACAQIFWFTLKWWLALILSDSHILRHKCASAPIFLSEGTCNWAAQKAEADTLTEGKIPF